MLAYVFWHLPRSGIAAAGYEALLKAFQEDLSRASPPGFRSAAVYALPGAGVPWVPGPRSHARALLRSAEPVELPAPLTGHPIALRLVWETV